MPASTATVSLDQAKDWAKRLYKAAPELGSLSRAQASIAQMLGHASWHALTQFHTPTTSPPAPSTPHDPLVADLDQANALYPGLDAKQVEVLAIELEELDCSVDEVIERAQELERTEGLFTSDAFPAALEAAVRVVLPPPGHRFVRVLDAKGQRVMTLLPFQPRPQPRPARR